MSFVIGNGPFQGVIPQAAELELQQNDRGAVTIWGTHHRTRVFLNLFNPLEGWSVDVTVKDPGLSMQDHYTRENNEPTIQPTREFEAVLTNPEGRVVARASVLKIINSEFAWKAGITSARNALYEALGLPSCLDGSVEAEDSSQQDRAASIKSVSGSSDASVDVVQGLENTGEIFTVQAIGSSEDTFEIPSMESSNTATNVNSGPADTVAADSNTAGSNNTVDSTNQVTSTTPATVTAPSRPKSPQASVEERQERAITAKSKRAVNGVPVGIKNRIAKLYKDAGLEVPSYSGLDEATQVLNQIVQGTVCKNGTTVQGALT